MCGCYIRTTKLMIELNWLDWSLKRLAYLTVGVINHLRRDIITLYIFIFNSSSQDVWLLYLYPEVADRTALIRLIFEEAGVPYTECDKPPEDGKLEGYPTLSPPLVKKGNISKILNTFLFLFSDKIWAVTCDFQQCGILTNVDSDEPVQPPLSLETPNDVQSVA